MDKSLILLTAGCVIVGGCGGSSAPEAPAPLSLAAPVTVSATGAAPRGRVSFKIQGGFTGASDVTLAMAQPTLVLRSTGERATITSLSIPLGDVDVSPETLPPTGLKLRQLVLHAERASAEVVHAEDDVLELSATTPLTLDWSLLLDDGTLYKLGSQHTDPVAVSVDVVRAATGTTATLQATCRGTCWSVAGLAQLSDGNVFLEADAAIAP
jgi:hypothetical protein